MRFRSISQTTLVSLRWAMNSAASHTLPSSSSPSEVTQKQRLSSRFQRGAERHARADGQPVAEAARRERDLIEGVDRGMSREPRALAVERLELLLGEEPRLREHGVQRCCGVAFREDEPVFVCHPGEPQKHQELGAGERAPDVGCAGIAAHAEEALLYREDALLERRHSRALLAVARLDDVRVDRVVRRVRGIAGNDGSFVKVPSLALLLL